MVAGMNERNYIRYRKLKAGLERVCFYICRFFPIDKKLISVCSFEGKGGFGCNPKYVVQELHKRNPDYKFVWFVNKDVWDKEFPNYIKRVNNSSAWSRAYWLSRSKVWIDNYRKPLGTVKRKGQLYINVNHYTIGIKCTGLLRGEGFSKMAYLVSKHDSDMIDELVIDSKWCEECFDKALLYNGHMLRTGAPRCDVLYDDRTKFKELFHKRHNLPANAKVVMYAPTFREGAKEGKRYVYAEECSLDFDMLLHALEEKFGGTWYACLRLHPQLAGKIGIKVNSKRNTRLIDESLADDMYEILAGMDAYITDYSSAVFEAGFAEIPSFVYADDIMEYSKHRGNLYWNFGEDPNGHVTNNKKTHPRMDLVFPFSIVTNNEDLKIVIGEFDFDEYRKRIDELKRKIGLVYDNKASKRLIEAMCATMNGGGDYESYRY